MRPNATPSAFAGSPGRPATGSRPHDDVFVRRGGRIAVDAENDAVQPLANSAKRVVGERVHPLVLKAAALHIPVPPLPDGGRAVLDRVAPGWKRPLERQRVREIAAPPPLRASPAAAGSPPARARTRPACHPRSARPRRRTPG